MRGEQPPVATAHVAACAASTVGVPGGGALYRQAGRVRPPAARRRRRRVEGATVGPRSCQGRDGEEGGDGGKPTPPPPLLCQPSGDSIMGTLGRGRHAATRQTSATRRTSGSRALLGLCQASANPADRGGRFKI